ncbi:MAG: CAP family protein [Deltaproteobacteria bacterium]
MNPPAFHRKIKLFAIFLSILAIVSVTNTGRTETTDDRIREEILAAHNKYRAQLGIPPLKWSETLADHAMNWALHLAQAGKISHSKKSGEGENLWQGSAGHFSHTRKVDYWGSEKKYFKKGTFPDVSTSGNWQDVGHYTQIIWRGTHEVGCAQATSGGFDFFVCRYHPPGNFIREKVY